MFDTLMKSLDCSGVSVCVFSDKLFEFGVLAAGPFSILISSNGTWEGIEGCGAIEFISSSHFTASPTTDSCSIIVTLLGSGAATCSTLSALTSLLLDLFNLSCLILWYNLSSFSTKKQKFKYSGSKNNYLLTSSSKSSGLKYEKSPCNALVFWRMSS